MNVLFINSAPARCSIHESGTMVAGCIRDSTKYNFTYATIDELDQSSMERGCFAWRPGLNRPALPHVDVSVFNWHIVTMPLPEALIAALPGIKLTIVLEAAPDDPLALTPIKAFDGYIVLDPTFPSSEKVFGFPRPLNPLAFTKRTRPNSRPRIGSFGLPTPGKGFELVIEAVNREFDEADVRINLPRGDYIATDVIHDEDYVERLRRIVTSIAKPGINVEFTTHYFSPRELVEWCGDNDLNCFMYTREQPGLSATTDQAIISGRPLLTIANPTFRHVAQYIPPYPYQSLKDAIESSEAAVRDMQWAWSPQVFRGQFEDLLDQLSKCGGRRGRRTSDETESIRPLVLVAEAGQPSSTDIVTYRVRAAAALDRSGHYRAQVANASSLTALLAELLRRRPETVLLLGNAGSAAAEWAQIVRGVLPQVRVIEGSWGDEGPSRMDTFQLQPIIPLRTTTVALSVDAAVLLLGFSGDKAALLRTLRTIARDDPAARVVVHAEPAEHELLRALFDSVTGRSRSIEDPIDAPSAAKTKAPPNTAEARNPNLRANSLAELLSWEDIDFVRCAYVTMLGRQPDSGGEAYYTKQIRAGRSKMEVLWQLRRSPEGQKHDPGIAGLDRALKRSAWARKLLIGRLTKALSKMGGSLGERRQRSVVKQIRTLRAELALARKAELPGLRIDVTTLPANGAEIIEFMAAQRAIIAQDDPRASEQIRDLLSLAYVTERQILISADRPVRPFSDLTPSLGEVSLLEGDRLGSALRVGTVLNHGEWAFATRFHHQLHHEQADAAPSDVPRALQNIALAGLYDLPPPGFVHAAHVQVLGEVPTRLQESEGEALLLSGVSRGSIVAQLEMRLAISRLSGSAGGIDPAMARRLLEELATLTHFDDREFISAACDWILERKPDSVEFRNHLDELRRSGDRTAWLTAMLGSVERAAVVDRHKLQSQLVLDRQFDMGPAATNWIQWLLGLSEKDFRCQVEELCSELGVRRPRTMGDKGPVQRLGVLFDLALTAAKTRETASFVKVDAQTNLPIQLFEAALAALFDLDHREYIGVLYRIVLERDPDPDGFSHYLDALQRGESRASVLAELLGLTEREPEWRAAPDLTRFPRLLELHPTLHLAIAWIEGLTTLPRLAFVEEVRRISSIGGIPAPALATDDPASRVALLLALALQSRSVSVPDEIAATRVRLWKAWSSIVSANHIGVVEGLEPLPEVSVTPTDSKPNRTGESSPGMLASWFGQQQAPRRAVNLFGEEPPSRLMSGIRPSASSLGSVYLLRGQDEASAATAHALEIHWPSSLLPLNAVEWNSVARRLEIKSTCDEIREPGGEAGPGCLLITGPLAGDEPVGLIGAISEARSRGWSVVAIAEHASTPVTLQTPDHEHATRTGLYWQALLLVDRVIATSALAERQVCEFLASELGHDDPSLVATIFYSPGIGAQQAVQEAAFAHRLASALPTLARGPEEFVGSIFYHGGPAAPALQNQSLPDLLRTLGVSVLELGEPSPVVPLPSNERAAWVIADSETDLSKLRKLRSAAARLSAKTVYLGPVPVASRGLMEELLNWDLVGASRFEDFGQISDYLKSTRLHVVDAESRFVYLDHPCEWSFGSSEAVSPSAAPNDENFTVGVALQDPPRVTKGLEFVSGPWGAESGLSFEWVDLSDVGRTTNQADLEKLVTEAAQLNLLIVDGPPGHVLDIVDRVTNRGTPCLVDTALGLPHLSGVLQVPFDQVESMSSLLAANIEFIRAELKTAARTRPAARPSERAGRLLELLASQAAFSAGAGHRLAPVIPQNPKQPLLSLCISTYNRGGWVAMNLDNIFEQIANLDQNIEVLLVDNCSTDNTEEVASRFMSHPRFRYVRNARNVGMLGNLSVTAQASRGKFVWIIGDDDFTRPGTIAELCKLLEDQSEYDLVCFNYGYVSYKDPSEVDDAKDVTEKFNLLEPPGPNRSGLVGELAPLSENFYTAIYSHVYRRRHAIRAYCQNTLGRPFSSLLTCVPTSAYTLSQMAHLSAYWFGEPSLVINSNVSWQKYGTLFDLEQLPRVWDLAERAGADSAEVDRRRANRLWLIEMMWRDMYASDATGNQAYFDPERVLMRLKHLDAIDKLIPSLRGIYEEAHRRGEPAARARADQIFAAWTSAPANKVSEVLVS
jgi:hypothetical protein